MICELCSSHESCGLFWIRDSHVLEKEPTKMWLCYWCAKDLQNVYGVKIKLIKGSFKPQRVSFPIKEKAYPESKKDVKRLGFGSS